MKFNSFMDVLGGIIILAIVTDIVTSKNTATIVTNAGNSYARVINAALGKG